MSIRALIVDDEAPARQRLRRMLGKTTVDVVGEAVDGVDALQKIDDLDPDVVFLDIEMPQLDGFGVAAAIKARPQIVFVTAYDEHALRAFEAAAIDYLVKPVQQERLERAVDRLESADEARTPDLQRVLQALQKSQRPPRVAIKSGSDYRVVAPADIIAVVAQDHYAVVQTTASEILCDDTLDAFHSKLDSDAFVRIHRSAIVNLDWVAGLEREGDRRFVVVLRDKQQTRLPVSRERLSDVKSALGL